MKTVGVLSLENIEIIHDCDTHGDSIVEQEVAAQAALSETAAEEGHAADVVELQQTTDGAEAVQEIATALEGYVPTHPRPAASAALQAAVTGLLKQLRVQAPAQRFTAMEEIVGYPTQTKLKNVSLEAMEGVRGALAAIWEKIIKLVKRIGAWLAEMWEKIYGSNTRLEAKAKKLETTLRAVRNPKPAKPATLTAKDQSVDNSNPAPRQKGDGLVRSNFINRHLFIGDAVPVGEEMLTRYTEHVALVENLLITFSTLEKGLIDAILRLTNYIGGEPTKFFQELKNAYAYAHIVKVGKAVKKTKGALKVQEVELVFANRSVWWTLGEAGDSKLSSTPHFKAELGHVSGQLDGDQIPLQPLPALSLKQTDHLLNMAEKHIKARGHALSLMNSSSSMLKHLSQRLDTMRMHVVGKDGQAATNAHLVATMRLLTSTQALLQGINVAVAAYDTRVTEAVLEYGVLSAEALAGI